MTESDELEPRDRDTGDVGDVSELAAAVAEGAPVDWRAVESTAAPNDLPVVQALREVETVLGAHRKVLEEESPTRRRPPPLRRGDTWSHLEIRRYLGGGGFGDVYEAFDPKIERPAALKILHAPEASDEALLREARLLAKLNHPNVVRVYGADRVDGRVGIFMERLDGHTLTDELHQFGPMSADDAVLVGMKLCDALSEVHRQGIVHRDVKAQNVMRARGGRIVLMDFGIGLDESRDDSVRPAGTPAYLAPELLEGGAPGVASDLYALGVLLFHLVTADFPVRGRSLREFRERHQSEDVRHLPDLRSDLPEAFVRVVETALSPDPETRFRSAGAFHRALSRAMASSFLDGAERADLAADLGGGLGRRIRRQAFLRGAALTALALLLLAGLAWWLRPQPPADPARILLAPLLDRSREPAFGASVDAALRSEATQSAYFEPVSESDELLVSRQMLRPAPARPLTPAEANEAARRAGAAGILGGELQPLDQVWILRLWLAPLGVEGLRATAEARVGEATSAALDAALEDALERLEREAADWLRPGGALSVPAESLESATTSSFEALRLFTAGSRAYADGDIEASEASLRRALQLDPEFALAHLQIGHSLAAQGNPEASLRAVERAYQLRDRTSSDVERLVIEGTYYGAVRQYRIAFRIYEQLLDIRGDDPAILRQMALAYRELGELHKAVDYARRGRYSSGPESINHGFLVYTLASAGHPEEALKEARGMRERFAATSYLRLSEALAYLGLDRLDEALAVTQGLAAEGDPTYQNLASWMAARVHIFAGDLERAAEILYRDRRTDAVQGTGFLEMRRRYWAARLLWLQGRGDDARDELAQADFPTIPSHMTGWRSIAVVMAELGDLDGARGVSAQLETLRARYPSLLADLVVAQVQGALLVAENRPDEALAVLAAGEAQSDVSYLRTLARAQIAAGQILRATETDRRLLERRGEILDAEFAGLWVEAQVRRARCLEQLGRRQEASFHWQRARRHWGDQADRLFGPGGTADVLPPS